MTDAGFAGAETALRRGLLRRECCDESQAHIAVPREMEPTLFIPKSPRIVQRQDAPEEAYLGVLLNL